MSFHTLKQLEADGVLTKRADPPAATSSDVGSVADSRVRFEAVDANTVKVVLHTNAQTVPQTHDVSLDSIWAKWAALETDESDPPGQERDPSQLVLEITAGPLSFNAGPFLQLLVDDHVFMPPEQAGPSRRSLEARRTSRRSFSILGSGSVKSVHQANGAAARV